MTIDRENYRGGFPEKSTQEAGSDFDRERAMVDETALTAIQRNLIAKIDSRIEWLKSTQPKKSLWHKFFGPNAEIQSLDALIALAEEQKQHIQGPQFLERLRHWEPWRLNERSVRKGENLYVNIAKAHADPEFLDWLTQKSEEFNLPEDELLVGIIETIRRAEWEAAKYLLAGGYTRRTWLPITVFHRAPIRSMQLVAGALRSSKTSRLLPQFREEQIAELFDKELALAKNLVLYEGEYDEPEGGVMSRVLGAASRDVISLESETVISELEPLFRKLREQTDERPHFPYYLGKILSEEMLHSLGFQKKEFEEQVAEQDIDSQGPLTYAQRSILKSHVPAHETIHQLAGGLAGYISDKSEEVLGPLYKRFQK